MSWGAVSDDHSTGEAQLAPEATKATFLSEATAAGYLLVELAAPKPPARGRLALVIDGAIERALEARGAPPPTSQTSTPSGDRELSLSDQIHRARTSGAAGLALWVSSLEGIATAGTLDCDDSAALRWWLLASSDRPVRLAFDAANRRLGVYMPPRTLGSILAEAVAAREPSGSDGDFTERTDEMSDVPTIGSARSLDAASTHDDDASREESDDEDDEDGDDAGDVDEDVAGDVDEDVAPPSAPESGLAESARAMAAELEETGDNGWLRGALLDLSTPPPRPTTAEVRVAASTIRVAESEPRPQTHRPERPARPRDLAPSAPAVSSDGDLEEAISLGYEQRLPPPPVAPRLELHFAEPHVAPERERPELDEATRRKLETYARELTAASGPKPLAVVERLFTNAYVPLRAALDRGADLPSARDAADEWARGFEKSYLDGFDALRVRSKRPAMTVDVPDIALRVARLHGARSTQLLLVDAMRFDLGDAVNERLHALVGQRAACAERFLLWAALPTTTGAQVELIGRGPAGLKDGPDGVSEDMIVARGRKASMIRRLKTGHREVLKLDVVAARITEPGGAEPSGFDAIADEVAQRIAAHFEGLQPRTLVMVFGDHGFSVTGRGDGPTGVREGGAFPEEVLVPAFAWLVGAVH